MRSADELISETGLPSRAMGGEKMNSNNISGGHIETIKCPECNEIQDAEVVHSRPWWGYFHECINCQHIILESEWERVNNSQSFIKLNN